MPGTTRYSATFDRTYEEDDRADPPPTANTRRSRSLSWQAPAGFGGRPYTPLGGRPPSQRSSSTDNGKAPDYLATRAAAKAAAKAHNNPFQFVKVGTCPLYKNAEELLKKTKEVKKQDVLKEEEEDWQSNLDSWKSRRRKMSEDVFRRQEEIKQFELEEQEAQLAQKKTKTFSEMVESRANRGRTLSLCLLSSPLEFQDWEFENKTFKNGSCSTFTDESEENSTVNSEDEGVSVRGRPGRPPHYNNHNNHRTNSDAHIEQNGSKLDLHNENFNKLADISADNGQIKPKEGSYIDSGLESISSSHRAGDTPDSGSDFSQDSNSSIDCDSPRTGVNILEEFRTKSLQTQGQKLKVKLSLVDQSEEFGFTFQCGKDSGQVHITSVIQGSIAESSGVHLGDQIISINGVDVNSRTHRDIASIVQKGREKEEVNLLLWRHIKANGFSNGEKHVENPVKSNKSANVNAKSESQMYERSIESENEMFVDDYEELERQSELLNSSNKSETTCTSSQNTNSQKVNSPAKQNEDLMNFNSDSLNIVFQSEPKSKFSENQSVNIKNSENNDKKTVDLAPDIPPVEKVAEEMEKLILEQLEEEERAKELASVLQSTNSVESPEHLLIAPSKSAEPPKEKPPPPPPSANEGSQKDPSLKRVNSTKRIKKEIHKRRSNFLGIDNVDESIVCSEPSIPPPPALEEILKAEMELDRQSRLKIESASTERLTLEEKEIMQKEREIIESLESEEREKQLLNGSEDFENNASAATSDAIFEDDRIISLKNERKRIENERFLTEEQQQLNQAEEKQLREREEFIRKQEEAIRKERERLRQEQEALQREREEHRQKLMLEQEELLKHQNSHAPDAPASRLGPLPPLVPPNFPPQLTTTTNAIPNARESTSFPSRSHHGTPNNAAGSMNAVELMGPPVVRQNKMPASRKAVVQIEAWGQQKMPSVRKQNHDSLTESRYNQNHWLIQEAEMRRIAELKERQQRATQLPCSQTHLAEDDVCSNPPRVPVISPPHNPHLNYAVQDKMWNYGQSNMPPKKYPPPVVKEPLHAVYPRETVSQQPPTKPSRVVPMERQEQMLSVSGRKRCSHCNEELGRGAAMIIESLQLYYHIHCFQCCVCQAQLGNGSCGTDVRVRNNKLHCHNCYSNDEAGLKFSQV